MILVTGASGNIGSEVARQTLALGEKVRVLSRDPRRIEHLRKRVEVEVARGDLTQPKTLGPAFAGATKLFLVCPAQELPTLIGPIVEEAKNAGIRHVVLISSATVLIEPAVTIGKWHLAAEEALKASGLEWTVLRPGNFASNSVRWAGMIRSQQTVFAPNAEGKSAPIDPRDIASVAVKALTTPGHEGQEYVLTGPELLSPSQQVHKIAIALGKTLRFVEVPPEKARAGMVQSGMAGDLADALLEVIMAARAGGESLQTTTVADVTGKQAHTFDVWVRDNLSAFS